ncbi:hypothetical protein CC2G_014311 [Coprinopsis cinerea AmutBmut pab1-1]|nr:hypothetical protein CC2G_014311 [Coprinopsis cinerea AmutBmut pab1-1]
MPKAPSKVTTHTPTSFPLRLALGRTPTNAFQGPTYDGSGCRTVPYAQPSSQPSSEYRPRKARGFRLHISIDASKRRRHSNPNEEEPVHRLTTVASGTSRPALSPLRIVQSGTTNPVVEKPKTPAHRLQLHAASSYSFTCGVPTPDSEIRFASQENVRTGGKSVSELESDITLLRDEIASIDESFRKEKELVDALSDEEFAKQYGQGVTRDEWLYTAGGFGQGPGDFVNF